MLTIHLWHFWNKNLTNANKTKYFDLVCMPGYTGLNCTDICPYPTYGHRCQGYCDCSNTTCDVSTGCRTFTTGQQYFPFKCLQSINCMFTNTYVFQ